MLSNAALAVKEQEIATIKEILGIEIEVKNNEIRTIRYLNTDEVNQLINGNNKKYENKIGVYRSKLTYLGDEQSQEEAVFFKERGFDVLNMTPDEFKYYIELGVLEDSVKEKNNIGRELQTNNFPERIQIGDNFYGIGWYLIGNYTDEEKENNTYQKQFQDLNLKDTTHSPYLVNYETGVVLSIDGMPMYQSQTIVHSFNDNSYDENLSNSITYVNSFTDKTGDSYGNLISTSKYTGSVDNYGGGMSIYTDNDGQLQYDEDGALILDSDNAIPVLEIEDNFKIDDSYSINVTIDGDYLQKPAMNNDTYANTIVALSDAANRYLSWIGVYKGYLHVYAYHSSAPYRDIKSEVTYKGFASIDISKYQGKPINVQVTATRGQNANVYINGEKVKTFTVGDNKLTFKYTTLGDLRVGRNLKFIGKIYEFGIYGIAIDDRSIQNNWERAKKYVEK